MILISSEEPFMIRSSRLGTIERSERKVLCSRASLKVSKLELRKNDDGKTYSGDMISESGLSSISIMRRIPLVRSD